MLRDIAMAGNGAFAFIPCPGFVGTIFVNSMANIMSNMGRNAKLSIKTLNGVKITNVLGAFKKESTNHDAFVHVGNLLYGSE